MQTDFTISVLQHIPVPANIPAALQRLETTAAQASADGCQLLVVPECSITGYNQSLESMQQVAITSDRINATMERGCRKSCTCQGL